MKYLYNSIFFKIPFSLLIVIIYFCSTTSCVKVDDPNIDNIAESYVKLALSVGLYDYYYIDAYFGPEEWKPTEITEEEKDNFPYDQLNEEVMRLIDNLDRVDQEKYDEIEKLRYSFLKNQLISLKGKIDLLAGQQMSFDEESVALYGVKAERLDDSYFTEKIEKLNKVLPGQGDIAVRFHNLKSKFVVPENKVDIVFAAAISEAKKRTLEHIELPQNEEIVWKFVKDKPWAGYNYFEGNSQSTNQINTDISMDIEMIMLLSCHEAYPGHHTHLTLLEDHLIKGRGWIEFSIIPLYSPIMVIEEGVAEYCYNLTFPINERIAYGKELAILAGLDTVNIEQYFISTDIREKLRDPVRDQVAQQFLDGAISDDEAVAQLIEYGFFQPEEAARSIQFIESYRSYVITYSVGEELVKNYVNRGSSADEKWELFYKILSEPHTPENLK